MRRLSYEEFEEEKSAFAGAIQRTDYLAKFCSNLPWQCAAYQYLTGIDFGVNDALQCLVVEEDGNWIAFAERHQGIFFPFESAWMFGCPLIGDPVRVLKLMEEAAREYIGGDCGFLISGVLAGSGMHAELRGLRERARRFEEFDTTHCMTIDLSEGPDRFLERRSRSFRKGIRQMKTVENLEFEDASGQSPTELFERILRIQSLSYKSKEGGDIFSDYRYESFYRELCRHLHEQGDLRITFARIEGTDAAYILGGVNGPIYRGFQMSYDNQFRTLALGNRLQLDNIRRMSEAGITHYDLGMHSPYKERWADHHEQFKGVFVQL